jgi:hypothetical protein
MKASRFQAAEANRTDTKELSKCEHCDLPGRSLKYEAVEVAARPIRGRSVNAADRALAGETTDAGFSISFSSSSVSVRVL